MRAPGTWAFPTKLHDLQLHVRSPQQSPDWQTRYAVRSGVEGTVNEFAHGECGHLNSLDETKW